MTPPHRLPLLKAIHWSQKRTPSPFRRSRKKCTSKRTTNFPETITNRQEVQFVEKKGEKKPWRLQQKIPLWRVKRYAKLYREYEFRGTVYGKILSKKELRKIRVVKNRKSNFPDAEENLEAEVAKRRSVGDKVGGLWLKAWMKQIVVGLADTEQDKRKASEFKASNNWLLGFSKRWSLSYRKKTNRKSRPSIKRSLKVRKFHWFAMYKARLLPSKTSQEWADMIEDEDPLTKWIQLLLIQVFCQH